MKIVKENGVVICRGYRFEVSEKYTDTLELAFYEGGKRHVIERKEARAICNYQDAWRFIESHIGSSANCDFTEEAIKLIFDK